MSAFKHAFELGILFLALKSRFRKGLISIHVHYYHFDKGSEGFFSYFTLIYEGTCVERLLANSKALRTITPEK